MREWHVNVEQTFFKDFIVHAETAEEAEAQVKARLENKEDWKEGWSVGDQDSDLFTEEG